MVDLMEFIPETYRAHYIRHIRFYFHYAIFYIKLSFTLCYLLHYGVFANKNTKGAIKNGKSRETGNTLHTIGRTTQHNMCWTPLCANKHNKNNVSKTMSPPTNNWR